MAIGFVRVESSGVQRCGIKDFFNSGQFFRQALLKRSLHQYVQHLRVGANAQRIRIAPKNGTLLLVELLDEEKVTGRNRARLLER